MPNFRAVCVIQWPATIPSIPAPLRGSLRPPIIDGMTLFWVAKTLPALGIMGMIG